MAACLITDTNWQSDRPVWPTVFWLQQANIYWQSGLLALHPCPVLVVAEGCQLWQGRSWGGGTAYAQARRAACMEVMSAPGSCKAGFHNPGFSP